MKFKIGDPVWAQCDREELGKGELAAVIVRQALSEYYEWYVEIDGREWTVKESWLRPRRPPDEIKREELGSWDLCPWQPKEVRA